MLYTINLCNLLLWVRYPRYIHASKELFGDAGELIVEDLLQQGQSLMSQVSSGLKLLINTHQQVIEDGMVLFLAICRRREMP